MEAGRTETQEEIDAAAVFLSRMIPALLSGASFEEAGLAVLRRDKELANVATSQSDKGHSIRKYLAEKVFEQINASLFAERQARLVKEMAIKDFLTTARAALTAAGATC